MIYARVSLKSCAQGPECSKLADREITSSCENGVVHRGKVAGRQDKYVLSMAFATPMLGINVHCLEIQFGKDVRAAKRTARMSGFGSGNHP